MKKRLKQRLFSAILCSLGIPFTVFLFAPMEIYLANKEEFLFALSDFVWLIAAVAVCVSIGVFCVLLLLPDKLYYGAVGLICGVFVMIIVQSVFLNKGAEALPSTETSALIGKPLLIVDTVLWILIPALFTAAAVIQKWHEQVHTGIAILLVVMCGMQLVGWCAKLPATVALARREAGEEDTMMCLSSEGVNEVAPGKNIIVFLLDRFDAVYYQDMLESDPNFFSPLTGFTSFTDNISLCSRTYPSVCGMITGIRQDYTLTADEYFDHAYRDSLFLQDLKDNEYAVRLYTSEYYAYRLETSEITVADNNVNIVSYQVNRKGNLAVRMMLLSAYRYAPCIGKAMFNPGWFVFETIGEFDCGNETMYCLNDAQLYQTLSDGLTLSDEKNAYLFYHLNGFHPPYLMDENGIYTVSGTIEGASRGCFALIYHYIDELKRMGLYENATIVITGDHPKAVDDYNDPTEPRITALFVKPAGASEEPLRISSAQVCDDELIPTLVQSAGMITSHEYGQTYFDIREGVDTERHHLFQLTNKDKSCSIVDFRITGAADDFGNWEIVSRRNIGDLYK